MIDWTRKRIVSDVERDAKVSKAKARIRVDLLEALSEFMDAVLADDKPALAKLKKYRDDTKAWLATPGGPDITKKPKRNGT